MGGAPLPRTGTDQEAVGYIKGKGLQDSKNRRMINADDDIRAVFGGKSQVWMFDMTQLVSRHFG